MARMSRTEIEDFVFARLVTLANDGNPDIAVKALKELATLNGQYAAVAPKALNATQQNTFVLSPEQVGSVLDKLKLIGGPSSEPTPSS